MRILTSLEPLKIAGSIALTIGNFDGVHLGHQALFKHLLQKADHSVVITFSNHPSEIISEQPIPQLTPLEDKLRLLASYGIHTTYVLPFTKAFSKQSPETFLKTVKSNVPFSHLILGHDAVIGHQRQGNAVELKRLASLLEFQLTYLEPVTLNGIPISSSLIRQLLSQGNLSAVSALLGRPYSL